MAGPDKKKLYPNENIKTVCYIKNLPKLMNPNLSQNRNACQNETDCISCSGCITSSCSMIILLIGWHISHRKCDSIMQIIGHRHLSDFEFLE